MLRNIKVTLVFWNVNNICLWNFLLNQMRDQFDSGEKTEFKEDDDNPHDVAALFKEYFRDLPEPLLTRDLYSSFLETQSKQYWSNAISKIVICCTAVVHNVAKCNLGSVKTDPI